MRETTVSTKAIQVNNGDFSSKSKRRSKKAIKKKKDVLRNSKKSLTKDYKRINSYNDANGSKIINIGAYQHLDKSKYKMTSSEIYQNDYDVVASENNPNPRNLPTVWINEHVLLKKLLILSMLFTFFFLISVVLAYNAVFILFAKF